MLRNNCCYRYYKFKRFLSKLKYALTSIECPMHRCKKVTKLDPTTIPKYKTQLGKPPVYKSLSSLCGKKKDMKHPPKEDFYYVDISSFKQQLLPKKFPKTRVWGYGGLITDPKKGKIKYYRGYPGPTFEAVRGIPTKVKWINLLKGKHLFAVDPTLHWANPNQMLSDPKKPWPPFPPGFKKAQKPIPIVTHLHGGEVPSAFDGHPDAWFTHNRKYGPAYSTSEYVYPNRQQPTTLWYHDHALGITRLNVYAGLAGFYLLRDKTKDGYYYNDCKRKYQLPSGQYEVPLVIQDRMFLTDGSLYFPSEGINPDIHPYWNPEFFGDTILVNGKVWPNLNVERRQYRFRILNGSNARFYNLYLSNGMPMIQIGTDGGFLPKPVELTSLLLAPAERADILINFADILPGTTIKLLNDAKAPFPDGASPDPETVGQIMQFTVPIKAPDPVPPEKLPKQMNCTPCLIPDAPKRILTLNEVMGPNGPTEVLLNGQMWAAPVSELPQVGSTEDWWIVNLTADSHPIHLHLVQFLLVSRQDIDTLAYSQAWEEANGMPPLHHPTKEVPVEPYLLGAPLPPDGNEEGWKDTIRVNPNQVTRIRVRFAPQDIPANGVNPGENYYSFDPSAGPGYVWHCHILDHEDNEMMRPYKVKP